MERRNKQKSWYTFSTDWYPNQTQHALSMPHFEESKLKLAAMRGRRFFPLPVDPCSLAADFPNALSLSLLLGASSCSLARWEPLLLAELSVTLLTSCEWLFTESSKQEAEDLLLNFAPLLGAEPDSGRLCPSLLLGAEPSFSGLCPSLVLWVECDPSGLFLLLMPGAWPDPDGLCPSFMLGVEPDSGGLCPSLMLAALVGGCFSGVSSFLLCLRVTFRTECVTVTMMQSDECFIVQSSITMHTQESIYNVVNCLESCINTKIIKLNQTFFFPQKREREKGWVEICISKLSNFQSMGKVSSKCEYTTLSFMNFTSGAYCLFIYYLPHASLTPVDNSAALLG